ncbi:MAG: hypothetical protein QM613_03645 [Micrococcaceae bacterium]
MSQVANRNSSDSPKSLIGPITIRDLVVVLAAIIILVASFFPLYVMKISNLHGPVNMWRSGPLILIPVLLTAIAAAALLLVRRFAKEVRLGSFSTDQMASIAGVVTLVSLISLPFTLMGWSSITAIANGNKIMAFTPYAGYWVALVGAIILFVATTLAPKIPVLNQDFAGREEENAHLVARNSARVIPSIRKPKASKGKLTTGSKGKLTAGAAGAVGAASLGAKLRGPHADVNANAPQANFNAETPDVNADINAPQVNVNDSRVDTDINGPHVDTDINTANANIDANTPQANFNAETPNVNADINAPQANLNANTDNGGYEARTAAELAGHENHSSGKLNTNVEGDINSPHLDADINGPHVDTDINTANANIDANTPQANFNAETPNVNADINAPQASSDADFNAEADYAANEEPKTMQIPVQDLQDEETAESYQQNQHLGYDNNQTNTGNKKQRKQSIQGDQTSASTVAPPTNQDPFWFAVPNEVRLTDKNTGLPFTLIPGEWHLALEDHGDSFLVQAENNVGVLKDISNVQRA